MRFWVRKKGEWSLDRSFFAAFVDIRRIIVYNTGKVIHLGFDPVDRLGNGSRGIIREGINWLRYWAIH